MPAIIAMTADAPCQESTPFGLNLKPASPKETAPFSKKLTRRERAIAAFLLQGTKGGEHATTRLNGGSVTP
jgi:hypothetical protein